MYVDWTFEHTWQLPGGGGEGAGTTAWTICVVTEGAESTVTPRKVDAAEALESAGAALSVAATALLAAESVEVMVTSICTLAARTLTSTVSAETPAVVAKRS